MMKLKVKSSHTDILGGSSVVAGELEVYCFASGKGKFEVGFLVSEGECSVSAFLSIPKTQPQTSPYPEAKQ